MSALYLCIVNNNIMENTMEYTMENLTSEEYTSMIASNDYWIDEDTMEWLFHLRYEAMSYEDSMATGLPS